MTSSRCVALFSFSPVSKHEAGAYTTTVELFSFCLVSKPGPFVQYIQLFFFCPLSQPGPAPKCVEVLCFSFTRFQAWSNTGGRVACGVLISSPPTLGVWLLLKSMAAGAVG